MLDRYRKPGGYVQLLNLLETSGKEKQEKFLNLIRQEDARWADSIEKKMLSIKTIFSWNQETIAEIIGVLQEMTVAVAMHGFDEETKAKIYATLSHSQKRKIDDLFSTHKPTAAEISTMYMKIITEVRKMISDGRLRMDKIDPELIIEYGIEEKLKKQSVSTDGGHVVELHSDVIEAADGSTLRFNLPNEEPENVAPAANGNHEAEVIQLRKRINTTNQENMALKTEVAKLKMKLDQIRKII